MSSLFGVEFLKNISLIKPWAGEARALCHVPLVIHLALDGVDDLFALLAGLAGLDFGRGSVGVRSIVLGIAFHVTLRMSCELLGRLSASWEYQLFLLDRSHLDARSAVLVQEMVRLGSIRLVTIKAPLKLRGNLFNIQHVDFFLCGKKW